MKIVNSILIFVLLYYMLIIICSTVKSGFVFLIPGEILLFFIIFINIISSYFKIKNNDTIFINKMIKNKEKENKSCNNYGYIDYWNK